VERLWRTVKYEEVYLHAYDSASHARTAIDGHLNRHNESRPHSSLGKQTQNEGYAAMCRRLNWRRKKMRSESAKPLHLQN
jgi:putative transposase